MMMPEYGMGVCCLQADSFIIIRNALFPVNRTFRRKSLSAAKRAPLLVRM